jgi:DNA-binding MarR family transcriptional regulator
MTYAKHMPSASHVSTEARSSAKPASVKPVETRPAPLAAELRVALMRAVRKIRQQRSSNVITDGQYSVLAWLDRHGPLTPRELAEREQVQPPSMTRTVNALVEAGLVGRTGHPDDGRQILVAITEAGTQEVKETRRRRDAWLAKKLAGLDQREREVLAEAGQILVRVVGP